MPSPNDSDTKSVPAGTTAKRRTLSRRLAEAASSKSAYWYRVGNLMIEWGLKGPEAKTLIEQDGNVVHWSSRYLRAIRRTVNSVMESGVSDQLAMQCPFQFVKDVMRHYRTETIEEEQAKLLIARRSKHVGPPRGMQITDVRTRESVKDVIQHLDLN